MVGSSRSEKTKVNNWVDSVALKQIGEDEREQIGADHLMWFNLPDFVALLTRSILSSFLSPPLIAYLNLLSPPSSYQLTKPLPQNSLRLAQACSYAFHLTLGRQLGRP
ncbi:UDP-glycosyltransferase 91C1-like [Pyrus ussuriensis x Pyrus communis]|uniref:UDP-glycosyltransferase 91C1-like n=1 Tax=Pyrus ussuriensis x Pyrus communis TaxID=2448454 RepID=A0A5N5GGT2_9ROSA|nr:UDP-glycosyltransferase 91C1-like [Pyrus ussuriensis x Pyrus communis]